MPDPANPVEYTPLPDFDFSQAPDEGLLLIRMTLLPMLGSGLLAQNIRNLLLVDERRVNKMMMDLKKELERRAREQQPLIVAASQMPPGRLH